MKRGGALELNFTVAFWMTNERVKKYVTYRHLNTAAKDVLKIPDTFRALPGVTANTYPSHFIGWQSIQLNTRPKAVDDKLDELEKEQQPVTFAGVTAVIVHFMKVPAQGGFRCFWIRVAF